MFRFFQDEIEWSKNEFEQTLCEFDGENLHYYYYYLKKKKQKKKRNHECDNNRKINVKNTITPAESSKIREKLRLGP